MIACPECGNENRDAARFCSRCSAPLIEFIDYYRRLNLAPDAPDDEVRQALRAALDSPHPPMTEDQMNDAVDTLTDPQGRAQYNRRRIFHLANRQWKKADLDSANYYRRLGISRFARRQEIQTAFDRLASLQQMGKVSPVDLQRLEEARSTLMDPGRRRAYNQQLDAAYGPDNVSVPHEINYYDYLGLDRTASEYQIRKADTAQRKVLTRRAKMGDEAAEETLRQLNLIIQTLTDEEKRAEYDADLTHDVFRFQTPGRPSPRSRNRRFAVIERIVYGSESNKLICFGGPWPDDLT